jgi:sarcosine oxidase subunit gamma
MTQPGNDRNRRRRISVSSLVDLHELSGFSLVLASTRGNGIAAARWLGTITEVHVSAVVGAVSRHENGTSVLGIGPGRWLVRSDTGIPDLDAPDDVALFDLSDAWRLFHISGIAARRLLASGCPLDLAPRRFAVGQCAATRLDEFCVILCCVTPDTYEMYVERSYAEDLRSRIVLRAAGLSAPADLEA